MRKVDDVTTFIVPKVMKNPVALTFWIPKGLFKPVAGKLYLFYSVKLKRHVLNMLSGVCRDGERGYVKLEDTIGCELDLTGL